MIERQSTFVELGGPNSTEFVESDGLGPARGAQRICYDAAGNELSCTLESTTERYFNSIDEDDADEYGTWLKFYNEKVLYNNGNWVKPGYAKTFDAYLTIATERIVKLTCRRKRD